MAEPAPAGGRRNALAAVALLSLILGELLARHGGWTAARHVAWGALALFLLLEIGGIGRTGRLMLIAGIVLGSGLWGLGRIEAATLGRGLDAAAFFALFVGVLGFLRVAAAASRSVATCGHVLANQPPGRRYLGLTVGAHVLGNLLNMSSLALLGSMIGGGGSATDRRRMLLACHRGFCAVPLWSPFAMTVALVLSLFPALAWSTYAGVGIGLAVVTMALGWAFDRLSRDHPATPPPSAPPTPVGVEHPFLRLFGLIGLLAGAIFLLNVLLDIRLILAVMTCVPLFALIWAVGQGASRPEGGRIGAIGVRLVMDLLDSLPALRNEVATLAGAAFIGAVAAAVVDAAQVRDALSALGLAPAMMVVLVPWAVTAAAIAGVSAIVSIMVLGQVLADLPLPRPPDVAIAAALTTGWACAVSVSPFTAVVLIVGRLADRSPWDVGLRWNGLFTLALLVVLSGLIYLVASIRLAA